MPAKPIPLKKNVEKGPNVPSKPVSENEKVRNKILEQINKKLGNNEVREHITNEILILSQAYKNLE